MEKYENFYPSQEMPQEMKDHIQKTLYRQNVAPVMGFAMITVTGIIGALLGIMRGVPIGPLLAIGGLMTILGMAGFVGSTRLSNRIKENDFLWKYGTVTRKRIVSLGEEPAASEIIVDGIVCTPLTHSDYAKCKEGQKAVIIVMTAVNGEDRKYALIQDDAT